MLGICISQGKNNRIILFEDVLDRGRYPAVWSLDVNANHSGNTLDVYGVLDFDPSPTQGQVPWRLESWCKCQLSSVFGLNMNAL